MLDAQSATVPVQEVGIKPLYAAGSAPAAAPRRVWLRQLLYPLRYCLSLVSFLVVIVYMLFVSIFQGLGMLGMYTVFPSFMRLVYPSCLGKLHSIALSCYRGCFLGEEGHSRSIRVVRRFW